MSRKFKLRGAWYGKKRSFQRCKLHPEIKYLETEMCSECIKIQKAKLNNIRNGKK